MDEADMGWDLADEGDWLELLVASDRILDLLENSRTGPPARRVQSLQKLVHVVQSREAYAEEARRAGAISALTALVANTDDEQVLDLAAEAIAACSGPLSRGKKGRTFYYGSQKVWIQEAALGDGLGARIWIAAHLLCRKLLANPQLVEGKDVLELGSGCGLCGILAAKLGARAVTVTDYEVKVLENLRECCAGNAAEMTSCGTYAAKFGDSEESNGSTPSSAASVAGDAWNFAKLSVRKLDWAEAYAPELSPGILSPNRGACKALDGPPAVAKELKFPCIIGSDLLYEVHHGVLVAAVLSERLDVTGKAYIALAVRRKEHLESLLQAAERRGLKTQIERETFDDESVGIVGREDEYEGGFVTVTLFHCSTAA